MTIAKQSDVRANLKKYFDLASSGETVIIPRVGNRNVVIISEAEFKVLDQIRRLTAYQDMMRDLEK